MKDTKKVLSVQDISCHGQCSNTVILPLLSAAGLETVVLPTALLSTHTGGFKEFTFLDMTEEMERILTHYTKINLRFDILQTGYFGSPAQIELIRRMALPLLKEGALRVVDPVLGDNGRLYSIYTDAFVTAMRELCKEADVITPNVTEACLLTETPYRAEADADFCRELVEKLKALGPSTVLVTGVRLGDDRIGVVGEENGIPFTASSPYVARNFHGTGDVFAGAFVGRLARGESAATAAAFAANFVYGCITDTLPIVEEHWYGLRFEGRIGEIAQK